MTEPVSYEVSLDELEGSARIPFDDQVVLEDVAAEAPEDEGTGHLPGGIRPYAL